MAPFETVSISVSLHSNHVVPQSSRPRLVIGTVVVPLILRFQHLPLRGNSAIASEWGKYLTVSEMVMQDMNTKILDALGPSIELPDDFAELMGELDALEADLAFEVEQPDAEGDELGRC